MPLLRVESRPKTAPPEPPRRGRRATQGDGVSASATSGALIGLIAGVIVVVAIAAFALGVARSRRAAPVTDTPPLAPVASGAPITTTLVADYPPEAVIATVGDETFTMAQLDAFVRVARVLGTLTGDPVPDPGAPEVRGFEVRMLRRQVDVMLMRQAAAREGVAVPGGPVDELVADFLTRTGGTDEQLHDLMTRFGVTDADVTRWFEDSRVVNAFVDAKLMGGRDPSEREKLVSTWLTGQWAARTDEIEVRFYDPDTVVYPPEPARAPAGAIPVAPAGAPTSGAAPTPVSGGGTGAMPAGGTPGAPRTP
jgi:hypothetical protein